MYTNSKHGKTLVKYLIATVFCVIFGAIYEHFSFGVYSNYMIYAFGFPLILGVLPAAWMVLGRAPISSILIEHPLISCLWHTGVSILTVGSIFKGILDIYGTASALTYVYWFAGGSLLLLALVMPLLYKAARNIECVERVN